MSIFSKLLKPMAGALAALSMLHGAAHAVAVDLELQLLVDVSGSVDTGEFNTQRDGYEAAFRDPSIIAAIQSGAIGSIAVQLIYWSGSTQQAFGVDWMLIDDATSSNAFADAIAAAGRPFGGLTAIGSAINHGVPLFSSNMFDGARKVIDVSGDGVTNDGASVTTARDNAVGAGITINGITIGNASGLQAHYISSVIGGAGAFHTHALSFADFEKAVANKIRTEIIGGPIVPIPGALPLMLTGLAFFGWRKKKKAQLA